MNGTHYLKCFIRAILAGMAISIGCCVYLGVWGFNPDNRWVGAVLFSIGLFTVFTFGLDLYTGKVGYLFDNRPSYAVDLLVIIIGNFVGCAISGYMIPAEGLASNAGPILENMVDGKLTDPDWFRVFCRGVFCGVLMFIAADYYKVYKKYLACIICVPVFILAGFEHSIADMFYMCSAGEYTLDALLFIIVVAFGNLVGGVLIPVCRKYMYEKPADTAQ